MSGDQQDQNDAAQVSDRELVAGLELQVEQDRADIAGFQAQSVVDHEIIAALAEQGLLDRAEISNLQLALVASRRIGAAIGIVMASRRVTEEDAFIVLRTQSQNMHRKLRDVAEDVLLTGVVGA